MREVLGTLFTVVFDILAICFVVWMYQDLPVWVATIPSVLLTGVGVAVTYCVGQFWVKKWKDKM